MPIKEDLINRFISIDGHNTLKNGLINYKKGIYSLINGDVKFIAVYSKIEKNLNIFASIGFYSCLMYSFKFNELNKELQEVLNG
jgi:hypothetical protein